MPVRVPAVALLSQLPVNVLGKLMEDSSRAWAPTLMWESWKKFQDPSFCLLALGPAPLVTAI